VIEKLNILQIAPYLPYPPTDGGKIGVFNFYKEFAEQGHKVTFLTFKSAQLKDEYIKAMEKYGKVIVIDLLPTNSIINLLKSFFDKNALMIFKYFNANSINLFNKLIQNEKFDVIHCDYSPLAYYGILAKQNGFKGIVGVRFHNVEYLIWKRYSESIKLNVINFFKKWYVEFQSNKIKEFELLALKSLDYFFPISQNDLAAFQSLYKHKNFKIVQGLVNTNYLKPNPQRVNTSTILLTANYSWVHNSNGLKWFLDNVMPILTEKKINFNFNIVGNYIPEWINKYIEIYPQIKPIGLVDDIYEHISNATITISPLLVGSGIRVKILESLACGIPCVSTVIGAEGLDITEQEGLYITDDVNEFADKCILLLDDFELNLSLGKPASELVQNKFSVFKATNEIIDSYKNLLNKTLL
jgi:glycosyltransferase involved in cell wall biosynthesis